MSVKKRLFLYSVFTGLLLAPAWYQWGTGLILLIALVPLLSVEDYLYQERVQHRPHKFLLYSFLSFFIWNTLTTWWIWNATEAGMFLAIIINSILMSLTMWLFHITRRNTGDGPGYFGLIVYWLVYEHFYMNGEINWPWLNLGNGFANDILIIQWYEYTGAFGGTLWVLISNILAFRLLKKYIIARKIRPLIRPLIILLFLIIIPISVSLVRFITYKEKDDPREIVVIQPNIDPYNEKFLGLDMDTQMGILLRLADSLATGKTDYFVAPETFINNNVWLHNLEDNHSIRQLYNFLSKYPRAHFVVGMTCYKEYTHPDSITKTANPIRGTNIYYDSFNASLQLDSTNRTPVYFKSKLVVGVEKMPYTHYLQFLKRLTLRLGGTFRSHGIQDHRESFPSSRRDGGVGTPICYESVFGEFVTEYVTAGATLIFVITNDGWWGDTPGHRQHHSFSRLRAIENRRSVARSANTGISSLINQRGQVLQHTEYWVADVIRGTLNSNTKMTFYTRHGDYIPRAAYFFALLILLYTLVKVILRKRMN
jgi:apolipoprotein N-acyltransferase